MLAEPPFAYPRTGFVLPEAGPFRSTDLVEYALDAADAGFESIWAEETWNYDPFGMLAQIATHTNVVMGTCIANAYARSPGSLAMGVATIQEATEGRFILGLGASTPAVVSGFHANTQDRPLRRLRELVEILELALSGERIDYDGEIFTLRGFSIDGGTGPVPVFNAALGDHNVALTVEHMDGVLPYLYPLSKVRDRIERVRDDLGVDRTPHVAASIPTAVSQDADEARDLLAKHVAAYVGSAEYYNAAVAGAGFGDEADAIGTAWADGDRDAATAAVTDDLVDAVGIAGTPTQARQHLESLLDDHLDTALISFPDGVTGKIVSETIQALGQRP
jgi:alkanesulfonate monooxygenase SsuD/methylene tetrahydromethanopterin reductase-like flavin-dependent oxidoreductase (luciferase family)